MKYLPFCVLVLFLKVSSSNSFPELGKWDFDLSPKVPENSVSKSLFKDSLIFIKVSCERRDPPAASSDIVIGWTLKESACWYNYQRLANVADDEAIQKAIDNNTVKVASVPGAHYPCSAHIELKPYSMQDKSSLAKRSTDLQKLGAIHSDSKRPIVQTGRDGFYSLTVHIEDPLGLDFIARVHVEMKGAYGYLSAANWYLLPFYGCMCLVYFLLGVCWLVVSFLQWRDLLRIQFWVGGVIFLGMLEVATFYAEYSNFNSTGVSLEWVVLLAEVVSCAKRTLARMLVIIVSLGFGIVKPRLGPMLHRVLCVGVLYFSLAVSEAYMRTVRPATGGQEEARQEGGPGQLGQPQAGGQFLLATVLLALLDSAICWWIFISLAQTTRTLRLRRNLVKLALYRHFTNILIFAVVSSVIFMLYSIKAHHFTICFKDWKELWIDDAFWRLLFSIILVVIMILWRPTNNNQRYAFSPLLDAPEDDDDEEEEQFVNDAYDLMFISPMQLRVKMRSQGSGSASPKPKQNSNNPDEDLKWVEENIPASLVDTTLPILDSDEEIMTTKFELSKMQ